jgi:hypothetical protein
MHAAEILGTPIDGDEPEGLSGWLGGVWGGCHDAYSLLLRVFRNKEWGDSCEASTR